MSIKCVYLYVRHSSSKLVYNALFVVLNFVKLCKYCNFRSEVYFNNKFVSVLWSSVICSGTLFKRARWCLISTVTPHFHRDSKGDLRLYLNGRLHFPYGHVWLSFSVKLKLSILHSSPVTGVEAGTLTFKAIQLQYHECCNDDKRKPPTNVKLYHKHQPNFFFIKFKNSDTNMNWVYHKRKSIQRCKNRSRTETFYSTNVNLKPFPNKLKPLAKINLS